MTGQAPSFLDSLSRRRFWTAVAFLVVIASGATLRFSGLGEPSLWLDEILHYEKAREALGEPWQGWLTGISLDRENGPLYYATQIFGLHLVDLAEAETGVRLMPALAGLGVVALLFWVGVAVVRGPRGGAAVGWLAALAPLAVYYAREGRPYAGVMLLAALLLWLAVAPRRRWSLLVLYGACCAAGYWGAVAAPVLLSAACLGALGWFVDRKQGHFVLAAGLGLVTAYLVFPEVQKLAAAAPTGQYVAKMEATSALSAVGLERLLASLTVSGVDGGAVTWLSLLLLAVAVWGGVRLWAQGRIQGLWTVGLCVLPIVASLAVLVLWDHWYNVRYTSSGLPAFLVLAGVGWCDLSQRVWGWLAGRLQVSFLSGRGASAVVSLGLLVAITLPLWSASRTEPWTKPDWRGLAELVGRLAEPEEPVIARDRWSYVCLGHYMDRLGVPNERHSVGFDLAKAAELTARHPKAWVVAAGYREMATFRAQLERLDRVFASPRANTQLYFFPSFEALMATRGRNGRLASVAAERGEEPRRQEFGSSELLLGQGWSFPETGHGGVGFRWATGVEAEIAIQVPESEAERELRLRVLPFPAPDRPPQEVRVFRDRQPIGTVSLEPGWNEVTLPWPEGGRLVPRVRFEFSWAASPREVDSTSGDARFLAAAFDWVEVAAAPGLTAP